MIMRILLGIDISIIILSTILALNHGLLGVNIGGIVSGCIGSCLIMGMLKDGN